VKRGGLVQKGKGRRDGGHVHREKGGMYYKRNWYGGGWEGSTLQYVKRGGGGE